jgi:TrmH family RNA methyltransferase
VDRPTITSPANPRIRAAAHLRERRERDRTGMTLVDGAREVLRAIDAGIVIVEAFITPGLAERPDGPAILDRLAAAGTDCVDVADTALGRLAFGDRSEGVVAVIRTPPTDLARLQLRPNPLVVAEGIEKPGNLGAILRSADGAGADALVVADARTDPFNPNAIRASLGTIFTVPLAAASSGEILAWLADQGIRAIAATVQGSSIYTDVDLGGPTAIVLGSEAGGLSAAWQDSRVLGVRIPMHGVADSLNVSVAAAVLLYEARRQRDAAGRPGREG